MEGISRKEYIELSAPTEADSRSLEERILTALREKGYSAGMSLKVMRKLLWPGMVVSGSLWIWKQGIPQRSIMVWP